MVSSKQIFTIATVFIFISSSILIYISDDEENFLTNEQSYFYPDLFDRHKLEWDMNGTHSYLLKEGPYESLEVQEAFINVDTSSVWETGPSAVSYTHLTLPTICSV